MPSSKNTHVCRLDILVLSVVLIFATLGCKKNTVRRKLQGNWVLTETTIGSQTIYPPEYQGRMVFHNCTNEESENGQCTVQQMVKWAGNGTADGDTTTRFYKVGDDGTTLTLDQDVFDLHVDDDQLIISIFQGGLYASWTYKRQ